MMLCWVRKLDNLEHTDTNTSTFFSGDSRTQQRRYEGGRREEEGVGGM